MARRTLTDSEQEQRAARVAALSVAADSIAESRPVDLDNAAIVLSNYSRRNVALILAQCEERGRGIPAAVAGFHEWRKVGRIVRKGAKGLAIFAPIMKRDAATGEDSRAGYTVRHVFDIADTDPITADSPATLGELLAG